MICACAHDRGWVRPERDTRALRITPEGRRAFAEVFAIDMIDVDYHAADPGHRRRLRAIALTDSANSRIPAG